MNYVRELITAMLVEGKPALVAAQEKGITSDLFSGCDGAALSFVYSYFRQYNALPPLSLVNMTAGYSPEEQLSTESKGASGFFADKLVDARVSMMLGAGAEKLASALELRDSSEAMSVLEGTLKQVRSVKNDRAKVVSLPKKFADVLAHHDRIQAGERGVMTPWKTMNDGTYGFGATDFVLFVARLGQGKTFLLLLLAIHAWQAGKKVLIASTEMDQLRMALRALALHFQIQPNMLRRGELGKAREPLGAKVEALADKLGLWMVGGGNYRLGFDSVEAAAEEVEPDIILMDGAYLLTPASNNKDKAKNAGRFDKAAETFEECKQFNLRMKVPVIATTQFNRSARRNSLAGAEVENIALSDSAGWCADYIFAILQTDEMRDVREMIVKPLKTREGSFGEFMIRWDIDRGEFHEIEHTRRQGGAAAAPGTGGAGNSLGGGDPFASGGSKQPSTPSDAPPKDHHKF